MNLYIHVRYRALRTYLYSNVLEIMHVVESETSHYNVKFIYYA
jgi:hypothetical protein